MSRASAENAAASPKLPPRAQLRKLITWFRRQRRDLPWRKTSDPYAIWVAEVMLQQTTVKSVVPYYNAFLARFPTLASLASTDEQTVLALWSGLGYYERARGLWRGACAIQERHGGRFPSTVESAITLPGVGLYTASAVLSIAFGRPLPVVDGNVRRVLARLLALKGRRWRKDGPYYNVADELLDRREPGDWNQALMELGATLCRPRRPLCPLCPWSAICSAHAQGNAEDYPEKKSRRTTIAVSILAVVIERDGRTLLARQDADAPLKGLWAVPHTPLDSERAPDIAEIEKIYGLKLKAGPGVGSVTHAITHRRITVAIMRADWTSISKAPKVPILWAAPKELPALPLSSLARKILRAAARTQLTLDLR